MKVHIKSDGTRRGTVVSTSDGRHLKGVRAVCFEASANEDLAKAEIELGMLTADIDADGAFIIVHPFTGHRLLIDGVLLADGTVLEFAEAGGAA